MCLILRVEGGFLSARRQEPGPDAPRLSGFNRYRLEALVESSFTQCGRPCSAFPSYFLNAGGNGRAEGAEKAEKLRKPAEGGTREGSDCYFGGPRLQFLLFYGGSVCGAGFGSSHGRWSGHVVGKEDGNHGQEEGRNTTRFRRDSCRYSSMGDLYD